MRFLLESVADLRASLRSMGTDLLIRIGEPASVLRTLVRELNVDRLCFVEEPGTEERRLEREVTDTVPVTMHPSTKTLLEIDDPRRHARELPEVFSAFRRDAERNLEIGPPKDRPGSLVPLEIPVGTERGELPALEELELAAVETEPRAALTFVGGESAGLERIDDWMHRGDHLGRYKITRNGMLGGDYSSKLSPWLALGAISSRRVAAETFRYERERVANDSTHWLRFEPLWREYFRLHLLKHGPRLFHLSGPADIRMKGSVARNGSKAGGPETPEFRSSTRTWWSWRQAASVNRGRQIVASFLAKNLGVTGGWPPVGSSIGCLTTVPPPTGGTGPMARESGRIRAASVASTSSDRPGTTTAKGLRPTLAAERLGHLRGMACHQPWDTVATDRSSTPVLARCGTGLLRPQAAPPTPREGQRRRRREHGQPPRGTTWTDREHLSSRPGSTSCPPVRPERGKDARAVREPEARDPHAFTSESAQPDARMDVTSECRSALGTARGMDEIQSAT